MNTLSIWRFDTSDGAEAALRALDRLQTRRVVAIDDSAVVVWGADARRPRGYQAGSAAGTSALSGAFWGLLFGLLFLLPLAGVADGDAVLGRFGLTEELVAHARARITAGTSALFLLADRAAVDRIREALARAAADLVVGDLDHEQEAALRRAFDADDLISR
jgi:uncharacterized membrane protein